MCNALECMESGTEKHIFSEKFFFFAKTYEDSSLGRACSFINYPARACMSWGLSDRAGVHLYTCIYNIVYYL